MNGVIEAIANGANWFIGLFGAGAEQFWGFVSGPIPLMIIFLTFMNTITILVGQDRMEKFAEKLSRFTILRYTVVPMVLSIMATAIGAMTIGSKFIPERCKTGYVDAVNTLMHPTAGLFPHVHASEIWVYMSLSTGISTAGGNVGNFAVRAFLVCLVVMLIRGILTEKLTAIILKRNQAKAAAASA